MRTLTAFVLLALSAVAQVSSSGSGPPLSANGAPGLEGAGPTSVLVVILDDVGVDQLERYGLGDAPFASTPTMDGLAELGVTFARAYAEPVCSPTRAAFLTGLHPSQVGVTAVAGLVDGPTLSLEELTLPEELEVPTALFGKWHLTSGWDPLAPNAHGFDFYSGALFNLNLAGGAPGGYYGWPKVTQGVQLDPAWPTYATTDTVDDAAAWIEAQEEPWLAVVSLHSAHRPWQAPPSWLAVPDDFTDAGIFRSMIEAADVELGRLLESVSLASTLVMVWGDNGTPAAVAGGPLAGAKASVLEGGIRVPLIVAGGSLVGSPGRVVTDVVHAPHDVRATVLEVLAGAAPETGDSLLEVLSGPGSSHARRSCYLEVEDDDGLDFAVVSRRWKLISDASGAPGAYILHDLTTDPFETVDVSTVNPDVVAALLALAP